MSQDSIAKAKEFLSIAHQFHLGALPTEGRHPLTMNLSELTKTNIPKALQILQKIELGVIDKVLDQMPQILKLRKAIDTTHKNGHKVYIYGCGATGRLALSLEYLWRLTSKKSAQDEVIGFMSGGDLALIHSIESFEDHPEWGARQVREIGFCDGDLLISCTEGGETPSVIGATEEANRISKNSTWFLYCNPDEILKSVERSRQIIENSDINKINLFVGQMSLSGSTRLQATTALMLAVGIALFGDANIKSHQEWLQTLDLGFVEKFSTAEADAYQKDELLLYSTNHYGITIMTDTTERAPTFSLTGFENTKTASPVPSLCYLTLPETSTAEQAWERLLLRAPRTLEWNELAGIAGKARLDGFDFSNQTNSRRQHLGKKQHLFTINKNQDHLEWQLHDYRTSIPVNKLHPLSEHLLLKFLLNCHSTIVMGRLGRFESNVMTWVKPSNNKLIDRAIRYVQYLLEQNMSQQFSYGKIAEALFAEMETLQTGEAIVLKTLNHLTRNT